jgi:hypothetical protein
LHYHGRSASIAANGPTHNQTLGLKGYTYVATGAAELVAFASGCNDGTVGTAAWEPAGGKEARAVKLDGIFRLPCVSELSVASSADESSFGAVAVPSAVAIRNVAVSISRKHVSKQH